MIKYYKTRAKDSVSEIAKAEKNCWLYLEDPSQDEIMEIVKLTKISKYFLDSALDEEEQARVESDGENHLIIIDIPKELDENANKVIITMPMAIIVTDNYFVTVCKKSTTVLDDLRKSRINVDTSNRNKLLYQLLYNNFNRFLYYLRKIDKMSNELQKNISKSMENKEILAVLELQKALVFFSASLSGNRAVLLKIINNSAGKNTTEEKELLDDIVIEARQAVEMCTIYREILKNSMDAFSSISNNNMNLVMKFLTAITIVLSIPMIISGIWGMNTGVPWQGDMYGFWITLALSLVVSVGTLIYFIKKRML